MSGVDFLQLRADEMMRQADELDRRAEAYRGVSFSGSLPGTWERSVATSLRLGAAALLQSRAKRAATPGAPS